MKLDGVIVFKRWNLKGGLDLEGHKDLSRQYSIINAAIPDQLIYPLVDRSGNAMTVLVKTGDRVLKGQVIAGSKGVQGTLLHAASSGLVKENEWRMIAHPSGLKSWCLIIATDGLDEPGPVYEPVDYTQLSAADICEKVHQAGIVGLGGASFPTAVKITPNNVRAVDTLIINGAECEPYITCDDRLMQQYPSEILLGIQVLLRALAIENCVIGIEEDMPEAIEAIQQAIECSGFKQIQVKVVPAVYPVGGERQLIYLLTGRETPSQGLPVDVGVVCQNVGTVMAVYQAIVKGQVLIERVVTVTGLGIKKPQNRWVRIGTPIKDLVSQCGGYNGPIERLIMGGLMMGFSLPDDGVGITKATNCILVATSKEVTKSSEAEMQPCIRCGECASACPVNLLPQQIYWHSQGGAHQKCQSFGLFDCIECGCCDVVCPSHIPLVQYFRASKSKAVLKRRDDEVAGLAKQRFENQQLRKAQEKMEREQRIRLKKLALVKLKKESAGLTSNAADKS
jgi:electron transport complex protein RnfC